MKPARMRFKPIHLASLNALLHELAAVLEKDKSGEVGLCLWIERNPEWVVEAELYSLNEESEDAEAEEEAAEGKPANPFIED